ncbi:MAG TPA: ATP-dependent helicase HrpB [Myxococcaceae bacterium]|nr:ATP-dependent helicase HrpB [Myxococcaceae bacterium]
MALHSIGPAVAPATAPAVEPRQAFGKVLQQARAGGETAPLTVAPSAQHARPGAAHAASKVTSARPPEAAAAKAVDQVAQAQHRLDRVLALAQSGKTFSPAELLGLQAQVYGASQELDLAGKVVEKATSGVKQILQTQI